MASIFKSLLCDVDWSAVGAVVAAVFAGVAWWSSKKNAKSASDNATSALAESVKANVLVEKQNSIHTEMVEQATKAADAAVESAKSAKEVNSAQRNKRRHEIYTTIRSVWYGNFGYIYTITTDPNQINEYDKKHILKLSPLEHGTLLSALLDVNRYFPPNNDQEKEYSEVVFLNLTQTHKPTVSVNSDTLHYSNGANRILDINLGNLVGHLEGRIKYDKLN